VRHFSHPFQPKAPYPQFPNMDVTPERRNTERLSPLSESQVLMFYSHPLKRLPSEFELNELWRRAGSTRGCRSDIDIKPTVKDIPGCEKLLALDYVYFTIALLD
jgi:hypothetical protein